jgi:hypothetical protein
MSIPPNNNIPDHPKTGDPYALRAINEVDGSYKAHSVDPNNLFHLVAKIARDAGYTIHMTDSDGHTTEIHHGTHKVASDAHQSTITGHSGEGIGGGKRQVTNKGKHSEHAGPRTEAVDGVKASIASQNHKTVSPGGDGHHSMKGDQSFVVDEGGIHYGMSKDYTISSSGGSYSIDFKKDVRINATENLNLSANTGNAQITSSKDLTIKSNTKISLLVGAAEIIIQNNSILLQVGSTGILITDGGISLSSTVSVADSSPGAFDAPNIAPPTVFTK